MFLCPLFTVWSGRQPDVALPQEKAAEKCSFGMFFSMLQGHSYFGEAALSSSHLRERRNLDPAGHVFNERVKITLT